MVTRYLSGGVIVFLGCLFIATAFSQEVNPRAEERGGEAATVQPEAEDKPQETESAFSEDRDAPDRDAKIGQTADHGEEAISVERGQYLAEHVALCVICHSPKDSTGTVKMDQKFEGGVIPVETPYGIEPSWAAKTPSLKTMVIAADEEIVTLLTTGIWPRTARAPRGPMPPFRMTESDARSIVAFLKTL